MTKFVFVTGGVVSSLGKGIAAASLAAMFGALRDSGMPIDAVLERLADDARERIFELFAQLDENGKEYMLRVETTPGRMLIGECLPKSHTVPFDVVNKVLTSVIPAAYGDSHSFIPAVIGNAKQFFLMRQSDRADLADLATDLALPESALDVIQRYPLRWWFPEDQVYRLGAGWRDRWRRPTRRCTPSPNARAPRSTTSPTSSGPTTTTPCWAASTTTSARTTRCS